MQNKKAEYGSDQYMPVVLPEMKQLLSPLSAEQFSLLKIHLTENLRSGNRSRAWAKMHADSNITRSGFVNSQNQICIKGWRHNERKPVVLPKTEQLLPLLCGERSFVLKGNISEELALKARNETQINMSATCGAKGSYAAKVRFCEFTKPYLCQRLVAQ